MRYKRDEAFRYSFGTPMPGFFRITKMDGVEIQSKKGNAELFDISPHGAGFHSELNLPESAKIELVLYTTLHVVELMLPGTIKWKKRALGKYSYGVELNASDDLKETIITDLKAFSKMHSEG
jgi:hypothetical protein